MPTIYGWKCYLKYFVANTYTCFQCNAICKQIQTAASIYK